MKIYTGSYSLLKYRPDLVQNAIPISLTCPKEIEWKKIKELAPSWGLLNLFKEDRITEEDYIRIYNQKLSVVNPAKIFEQISAITNGEDAILMCWCGKDDFCHRHLTADWLERELSIEVREFSKKRFIREKGHIREKQEEQLNMF